MKKVNYSTKKDLNPKKDFSVFKNQLKKYDLSHAGKWDRLITQKQISSVIFNVKYYAQKSYDYAEKAIVQARNAKKWWNDWTNKPTLADQEYFALWNKKNSDMQKLYQYYFLTNLYCVIAYELGIEYQIFFEKQVSHNFLLLKYYPQDYQVLKMLISTIEEKSTDYHFWDSSINPKTTGVLIKREYKQFSKRLWKSLDFSNKGQWNLPISLNDCQKIKVEIKKFGLSFFGVKKEIHQQIQLAKKDKLIPNSKKHKDYEKKFNKFIQQNRLVQNYYKDYFINLIYCFILNELACSNNKIIFQNSQIILELLTLKKLTKIYNELIISSNSELSKKTIIFIQNTYNQVLERKWNSQKKYSTIK